MKTFLIALTVLISAFLLSCSSDDSTNPTKPLDKNLLGTWNITEIINKDSLIITINITEVNSDYGGDIDMFSVVYTQESGSTKRVETILRGTLSLEYNYPNIKIKRGLDTDYLFTGTIDSLTNSMTGKIIALDKDVTILKK
jgi:hypothetical protein